MEGVGTHKSGCRVGEARKEITQGAWHGGGTQKGRAKEWLGTCAAKCIITPVLNPGATKKKGTCLVSRSKSKREGTRHTNRPNGPVTPLPMVPGEGEEGGGKAAMSCFFVSCFWFLLLSFSLLFPSLHTPHLNSFHFHSPPLLLRLTPLLLLLLLLLPLLLQLLMQGLEVFRHLLLLQIGQVHPSPRPSMPSPPLLIFHLSQQPQGLIFL